MKRITVVVLLGCIYILSGALDTQAQTLPNLIDGLVSYWTMDETSGVRYDVHGSDHFTDNNTVGYTADGVIGNTATFVEASSEYLSTDFDTTRFSNGLTISLWARLDVTATKQWIMTQRTITDTNDYSVFVNMFYADGKYEFRSGTDSGMCYVINDLPVAIGQWVHIVAVRSEIDDTARLIVNGVAASITCTYEIAMTDDQLVLGSDGTTGQMTADLDEVAIWNRALSDSEVSILYNSGYGLPYNAFSFMNNTTTDDDITTNLAAYWKLDETSGTRVDAHNTYDLTEVGMVPDVPGKRDAGAYLTGGNHLMHLDNETFSPGLGSFSIAMWVKLDNLIGARPIIHKENEYSIYVIDNTHWQLNIYNGEYQASLPVDTQIKTGTWYFVTAYHNGANRRIGLAINNSLTGMQYQYGIADTSSDLLVGYDGTTSLDGTVDEIAFWRRVLSHSEILYLYSGGNGRTYPLSTPEMTEFSYLPIICYNSDCASEPVPDDDDDDDDDTVILGPPQGDDTWREWVAKLEEMLSPIIGWLDDLLDRIDEWNARGCDIKGEFIADNVTEFAFTDEDTFQDIAYNFGVLLGEPIGQLRGFMTSEMVPLSFVSIIIGFLLAAMTFIVSVTVISSTIWLLKWLYHRLYEFWKALRG